LLTWDQGADMAHHARLRSVTALAISFCDPHSPLQRSTNENTNRPLRQYFPEGPDVSNHTATDLDAVAAALNSRPRKTLGWKTSSRPASASIARAEHSFAMRSNALVAPAGLREQNTLRSREQLRRFAAHTLTQSDQLTDSARSPTLARNHKAVLRRPA
jgi:hypothetical protein